MHHSNDSCVLPVYYVYNPLLYLILIQNVTTYRAVLYEIIIVCFLLLHDREHYDRKYFNNYKISLKNNNLASESFL